MLNHTKKTKKKGVSYACVHTHERTNKSGRSLFVFCGMYDCMLFVKFFLVCVCVYAYVCMYACMRMCACGVCGGGVVVVVYAIV